MSLDMLQGAQDYSFIPLVLDTSQGHTPTPPPITSYSRSNVLDRGPHHDRAELPRQERKSSTDTSHYEMRGTIPHIATQDKNYELSVAMDRKDIPRISHDHERPSDKQISSRSDAALNKSDAQAPRDQSLPPDDKKAETNTSSSGFELGEVPRERKKSIGNLGSPELDELQEKFKAITSSRPVSSQTISSKKTPDAVSLPPRGDSFRPPVSRTDSPVPVRGKSFDLTLTPLSPGRSLYSQASSSSSTMTAIELPGDENSLVTQKDASSPPPRPSTVQDSGFSPSHSSESEMSPSIPPLNKVPMAGLGFEDEIKRVFDGGFSDPVLRRVSDTVKHGRSLSEAARLPYSPGSGLQYEETTLSSDALKQELRRSTQRIVELEAKLNVRITANPTDPAAPSLTSRLE